ncbi:MAG: triose-phosphate isomerase [Candidatus Nanohaloarchaea archaeon]
MIVVNFKTYSRASGKKAREMAEECMAAGEETGERVVVAPQPQDLLRVEELDIDVFAQHIDPLEPGSHTGHLLPESLKEAGATGTLINHSEKRLDPGTIEETVEKAKELGMTTIVCAQDPEECEEYSSFGPDYVAYEPPELIGGDVSVSESKPELIEEAVEKSRVPVLTGAGIHTREDVEKSVELGCEGVLVASGVIKNDDPEAETRRLCRGLGGGRG